MINIRRHNPVLKARLMSLVKSEDAVGLKNVLGALTVAEFRTAGYILAEEILPALSSEVFWKFFLEVVPSNSKAYLGTFLKAAVVLKKSGQLDLDADVLVAFKTFATGIDIQKFSEALLPELRKVEEVELLVDAFSSVTAPAVTFTNLINTGTAPAYFVLFKLLQHSDCEASVLRHQTILLMKSRKEYAFNMASIVQQYFDLDNVPGHFSLRIEPFELSCLDQNFESFCKILKR